MTILNTKIDNKAEEYLLEKSQYRITDIDAAFNSAYHFDEPYMQISKLQATALQFFIKTCGIKKILEVGTFVGFSAFSMAAVLGEKDSKLVSIEINKDFFDQAETNKFNFLRENNCLFKAFENITFINEDAKKTLRYIDNILPDIDMMFLDGDKENYMFYFDWALNNLKSGAYFIIDNALFKGGVIKGEGKYSKSIRDMTEKLKESQEFDYFFLPVGDCMLVAKKK